MKILKGVIKYTFISLGVAIGAAIIVLAVMLLFPNVEIFGYKWSRSTSGYEKLYIIQNKDYSNPGTPVDLPSIRKIVIDAKGLNVNVYPYADSTNVPTIEVKTHARIQGLVKTSSTPDTLDLDNNEFIKVYEPTYSTETIEDESFRVLNIKVDAVTEGLFRYNNSYINIGIPATILESVNEYKSYYKITDVDITSTSGEVTITTKKELDINNTKNIYTCFINSTNVVTESGNQTYTTDKDAKYENIKAKTTSGSIKIDQINTLDIESDTGSITINTFTSGTIKSNQSNTKINSFENSLTYEAEGGLLTISESAGIVNPNPVIPAPEKDLNLLLKIKYTDVVINKLMAHLSTGGNACENSNITIEQIDASSNTYIRSGKGVVSIKECIGSADIRTTSGDITIDNLKNSINVASESGNIKVICDENLASTNTIKATSKNGNVNLLKVNCGFNVNVEDGGNAIIKVFIKKVVAYNNTIKAQKGAVTVASPIETYVLTTSSTEAKVNVKIGSVIYETGKETTNIVNAATDSSIETLTNQNLTLKVTSTNGNITIEEYKVEDHESKDFLENN